MNLLPKTTRIRVAFEEGAKRITILPTRSTVLTYGAFMTFLSLLFVILRTSLYASRARERYFAGSFDPISNPYHSMIIILGVVVFLLFLARAWEGAPETFHLRSSGLAYTAMEESVFFDLKQLQTLKLRRRPNGYRLFIHNGTALVELVQDISDQERVWLYKEIADKYSLDRTLRV